MPKLTARAFSEMLHLPGYEQQRILHEQKYPKQGTSVFRIPYYIPALSQIKAYYSNGNNVRQLHNWVRTSAISINPDSKRIHNIRVVSAFSNSIFSNRNLLPNRSQHFYSAFPHHNVELKLTYDIEVMEDSVKKYVFINCRNSKIDQKIAEDTLQIAYWVMTQSGIKVTLKQLEYWDLTCNVLYSVNRVSKRTITNMTNNATLVDVLWNSI